MALARHWWECSKRCEIEEDDVVDLLESSEKRRWDMKYKDIELGER